MLHKGYFNKIYNTHVALPHILFEKIITCKSKKNHHMQEKEKSKQKKENTPNNVIISMRYVYGK